MQHVANTLQDICITHLHDGNKLQQTAQNSREPAIGQTIWFYKLQDIKKSGILFGTVVKREGSDFLINISNGGSCKLSPERLHLVFGDEEEK